MILFLGVLVSASVLVPAAEHAFEEVSDARDGRSERLLDRRNSGVGVANVTCDEGDATLNVSVNNTGSVTLAVSETDVLVDGTLRTGDAATVGGVADRSLWLPGETLTVTVSGVACAPDRVKVVAGTGVAAASSNVTVVS